LIKNNPALIGGVVIEIYLDFNRDIGIDDADSKNRVDLIEAIMIARKQAI
jgi:hypothetical protein